MDSNYVKEQKSKKSQYTHEEETGEVLLKQKPKLIMKLLLRLYSTINKHADIVIGWTIWNCQDLTLFDI